MVPTLNWGKGLVIIRRKEEGAVLYRVAIYLGSGGSRVGAESVATRRDPRLFGAVTLVRLRAMCSWRITAQQLDS